MNRNVYSLITTMYVMHKKLDTRFDRHVYYDKIYIHVHQMRVQHSEPEEQTSHGRAAETS